MSSEAIIDQLLYATDGYWRQVGHARINASSRWMAGGPAPIVCLVASYLFFVRVWGPRWMESRKPFELLWPIRLYNIIMVTINGFIFVRCLVAIWFGLGFFGCHPMNTDPHEVDKLIFYGLIYFYTKIFELLDTVFFVLRKKHKQASKLHLFHHANVIFIVWTFLKFAPGGSSLLFPCLNMGVHTLMYAYYLLATFKSMQPYLWWKSLLTKIQIGQFALSMVHFSVTFLSGCHYSPALAAFGFTGNLIFTVLFLNFYRQSYLDVKAKAPIKSSQQLLKAD